MLISRLHHEASGDRYPLNIKYVKRWYEFYSQEDENLQQLAEVFNSKNRQQLADDLEMPIEFGLIPWDHHIDIIQWWNGHSAV